MRLNRSSSRIRHLPRRSDWLLTTIKAWFVIFILLPMIILIGLALVYWMIAV